MTSYYCQGHGGCECAWIPEIGPACDGNCDAGPVSYCDGTCSSAMQLLEDDIIARRMPAPAYSTDHISLGVNGYGYSPESWTVRFEGPDAEKWALAYIAARPGCYFSELIYDPFSGEAFPALAAKLYPLCEHGMSAALCEGPWHYMTPDQERARGW